MIFPHSPIAVEEPETGRVRVALRAESMVMDGAPIWQVAYSDQDTDEMPVGVLVAESDQEVRFRSPNGLLHVIRPLVPSDSERSRNHPFFPGYPLPVEIIGAIVNNMAGQPTLYAAVDGDGDVHTMVLWTDQALYARYGRAWVRVNDAGTLGQFGLVEVADGDLDAYDQADEAGRVLTRGVLTQVIAAGVSAPPVVVRAEPVTASAPMVTPMIASVDDIPAALEFAVDHPDSRWYLQKRANALGWTPSDGTYPEWWG